MWFLRDPPVGPEWFLQWILQPFGPRHWERLVLLVVMPLAKPHNALGRCWDLAEWALLGGGVGFEPAGRLVPGADVVGLCLADVLGDFGGRGPVDPANEALTVSSVGKSTLALLFGLSLEQFFNLPPGLAKIDVGFSHKCRLVPVPVI